MTLCAQCAQEKPVMLSCSSCNSISYCSKECQKVDWKKHKNNCSIFICREITGKGFGLVATRIIKQGEVLIKEEPVLVLRKDDNTRRARFLQEQFEQYTQEIQERILSLHDESPNGDKTEKLRRVFESNAIDANSENSAVLYLTIPRINHSCRSNVVWSWVAGKPLCKEVRALRKIEPGEEILANYIDAWETSLLPHKKRQKALSRWNFICNCEVCSLPKKQLDNNDIIRQNIMKQHNLIPQLMSRWDVEKAIEAAKTKLDLIQSLKDDLLTLLPAANLEVYELIQIGQAMGVGEGGGENYLETARQLAAKYGDSFRHSYTTKMQQVAADCNSLRKQKLAGGRR